MNNYVSHHSKHSGSSLPFLLFPILCSLLIFLSCRYTPKTSDFNKLDIATGGIILSRIRASVGS